MKSFRRSKDQSIVSYDHALDNLSTGIIIINSERSVVYCNQWMVEASEWSIQELELKENLYALFPEIKGTRLEDALDQCFSNGWPSVLSHNFNHDSLSLSSCFSRKNGLNHIEQKITVSQLKEDRETLCLLQIEDKTFDIVRERKLRDKTKSLTIAVNKSVLAEQKLLSVLRSVGDSVILSDSKGKILLTNPATETIFGYTEDYLIGRSIEILMPASAVEAHKTIMVHANPSTIGERHALKGTRRNGKHFPIDLMINVAKVNSERAVVSVIRDISIQIGQMEKLTRSLELAETLNLDLRDANERIQKETMRYISLTEEAIGLRAEAEIKTAEEVVLTRLLTLALNQSLIEEFLNSILDILIDGIAWLGFLPKAGIFLAERNGDVDRLALKASRGFEPQLLTLCANIEFRHCLCGRAAATGKTLYASSVDERHETQFEGMKPHGHYNVPMIVDDRSIGVLIFYLPHGHAQNKGEIAFLERVASTIAAGIMRRKIDQELIAAREVATQANHAKSQFLANMSHEIRTPMNGVLGMADLMLMSEMPDDLRENIMIIKNSGNTLMSLLNDILDLSKIEVGKLEVNATEVDVVSLIDSVASLTNSQIRQKGLQYNQNICGDLVSAWITTDIIRVRQILTNLLNNAIKFTHEGSITLSLSQSQVDDGRVETRFEVTDTGIGLSEEQQALIFQAFTQADQSTTRRYGGTGLGLSISKQLTELMGGKIGVKSKPGEGSTFSFTIVCDKVSGGPVTETENTLLGSETRNDDPEHLYRLLVAEDNTTNQLIIGKLLDVLGFKFEMVNNGQEAVNAVSGGAFNLILMDINMPIMGGVEATRLIRDLPGYGSSLPIIALTANAMEGDREKYLAAGMNDYITKPINPENFLQILVKHIKGNQEEEVSNIRQALG